MRNRLTKNIGLKIISLLAAFILWLVVVNVDDPVISRTYTGISVEVLNDDLVEERGQCYEILQGTNTINVVVTAKRSVVDEMSKDYIKATADFANLTYKETIPIEVRSTRYSDKIESVTTRTEYLKLKLEDIIEKPLSVTVDYEGEPAAGFLLAAVDSSVKTVAVKGPESVVGKVASLVANVDITGINKDTVASEVIMLYDEQGNQVQDDRLTLSDNITDISFTVNGTKDIPIGCGYSGNPLSGFAVTGTVTTEPSSVRITGRGENFDDIDMIYISPDDVNIEGVSDDFTTQVNISDYLPTGVSFADPSFDPVVNVTIGIEATQKKVIHVPISNIVMQNVPEEYVANIVDTGGTVMVEIQGLGDTFDRYSGDLVIGSIDAQNLVPRTVYPEAAGAPLQVGENDGLVTFDFPIGITETTPVNMLVIVDYVGDIGDSVTDDSLGDGTTEETENNSNSNVVTAGAASVQDNE